MARLAKAASLAVASGALILAAAGGAVADSGAAGAAIHSPGLLSGNVVQVPVHVPVNVCGNSVNVIGAVNPAFGNECVNDGGGAPHHGKPHHDKPHHGMR